MLLWFNKDKAVPSSKSDEAEVSGEAPSPMPPEELIPQPTEVEVTSETAVSKVGYNGLLILYYMAIKYLWPQLLKF